MALHLCNDMTPFYKEEDLNDDQWLLRHARNVTSISGEDGILQKIFEVMSPANRWCVEFGAWDGKTYSNTYHLIQDCEWSGVLIEADRAKYADLLATYHGNRRAVCLNCFVTFAGDSSLDNLLKTSRIPKDFDLLSIDIDGNDYHIWHSLSQYTPRVVVIEFNQTIPSHVEFVQPRDMRVNQGSSLLSLAKLGKTKGYELICATQYNAIFVQAQFFHLFRIANNNVERLRSETGSCFHLFQLFDGTFVVGGLERMPWHDLPIRPEKFQVLPKVFRQYPPRSANPFKRALRNAWAFLYRKGLL